MDVQRKSRIGRHNATREVTPTLAVHERPAPPDYLTEEEAAEWTAIVERMPPDCYTRELHPLLAAYCQHIMFAHEIVAQIKSYKVDVKTYKSLKTQIALRSALIREHRAMAIIALKLRLTPSSRHDAITRAEIEQQPTVRPSFQVDHAAA